jgi:hypothetical protein
MRGTVRMAAAAAAGVAVIVLAAGCGTGQGAGRHGVSRLIAAAGRAPTTGSATGQAATGPATAGPPVIGTAQAQRLVRALLARAQPPPGATPLAGRPPAALAHATEVQAGRPEAARHRLWRVAGPASAAYAFEARHVPAGMVWMGSGQGSYRGTVTEQSVSYRLRRLPAGVAAAGLSLSVAPDGAGGSVLRADAQVIWYPPRSAAEYVRPSMHAVTVTATVTGAHPRPRIVTRTVTAPSVLARLAAMLNGVHAAVAGAFANCPVYLASYRIAFAVSRGAAPSLVMQTAMCPDVQVTAGGQRQPALQTPAGLQALLQRITGVAAQPGGGFPPAPGKPVPGHGRPGTTRLLPP